MSGNSNHYSNSNSRGSSGHESYHDRNSGASDSRCRGGYRGRRGFDHYDFGARGPRRGRGRTERYYSDRRDSRDYRYCHATYTGSHRDVDYRNNDREESPRASPRDPIYKKHHLGENKHYDARSRDLDCDQYGYNSKNDHGTVRGDFGEYTMGGSELRDRPQRVEKFPTGISDSFALVDERGHQGERMFIRQHHSSVLGTHGTHGTDSVFETHGVHGNNHAPETNGTYGDQVTRGIYGNHETCGAHVSTGAPGSPGSPGLHVTQGTSGKHGPPGNPVTQSNQSTHTAHVTHITHSTHITQGTSVTHTTHAAHVSSFAHKHSSDTGQESHRTSGSRDFTLTGPLTDHLVKSYAKKTSSSTYKNPWISLLKLGEGKTASRLEQNHKDLTKVNDKLADLQNAILKHTCSLGLLDVYAKRDAINVEICSENLDEFTYL